MSEIKHQDYQVSYNEEDATIACSGSFRLQSSEYEPIMGMLNDIADKAPSNLILDVRKLQFLNSSGINTLSKFVLRVRKNNVSQVLVKGTNEFPWQKKSLSNLQKLLPTLELELE